ncbi:3-hydroxyacyl-CoA dehydrogenase PaaH [Candidatus Thalassolituus haligoni]|uniref:3-hydroxyacyl-CoA dehydrogenase PaaH n=1 Tax=Candidatus Thalassolituus haligoni TaxID=3100113 RepID=UPI003512C5EE
MMPEQTHTLSIDTLVAVIGAGAMGAGIAQVAAQAGHPVKLYDNREGAAAQAIDTMAAQLNKLVARGKLTAEQRDAVLSRITPVDDIEALVDAKLVIEAIIENLDVKRSVLATLEDVCSDDCILASNTSSLSITSLAAGRRYPGRIVGMHFFNPAPIMKLVEVVSGLATDSNAASTVYDTALNWGKKPVHTRSTPGFIVNRVARPFYAESLRLLQEQASDCATLDALMRDAGGFRMGAFELTDLIGHDVNYAVTCSVFTAYYGDFRFQPSLIQKELVDAGYLGRKASRGFYHYGEATEQPLALTVTVSSDTPSGCVALGDVGLLSVLVQRLAQAGISVDQESASDAGVLRIGTATVALTDGRLACQRALEEGLTNLVLIDLALDYNQASRLAISRAHNTSTDAVQQVVDCLAQAGIQVSELTDVPGLAVMRTVCMLANEGADAVLQGVGDAIGVDTAMCFGVNYPRGPLRWADQIGLAKVDQLLTYLQAVYGEDRYRPSLLIRRLALQGGRFHD